MQDRDAQRLKFSMSIAFVTSCKMAMNAHLALALVSDGACGRDSVSIHRGNDTLQ